MLARARALGAALAVLAVAAVLVSASYGPLSTTPWQAAQIVLGHLLPGMPWMRDGSLDALQDQAVWDLRLPRALLAGVVGAALALAGTVLQVTVRNPLAEPYILGISAGAGLGAVVSIVAGGTLIAGLGLHLTSFVAAVLTVVAVHALSVQRGVVVPARLVLVGVAVGSLLSAVTNFLLMTTDAQKIYSVMHFLLGSVSAAQWDSLWPPGVALAGSIVVVLLRVRALNALLVGDEAATALGVDVPRLRQLLLVVAALLTATTVAVAGSIGFVGLVVPHVVRLLVGSDHRLVVPLSVLGGAALLTTCDVLARVVAHPAEIPLGILTAALGAPCFLWIMRRKEL